jgi:diguanylate cyclase
MRQLQPTPENYRSLYHEIAGTKADDLFPERALKLVCSTLPRLNQAQVEFAERLETPSPAGAGRRSADRWSACCAAQAAPQRKWTALLKDLFKQFERPHASLTSAQKQQVIQQLLDSSNGELDVLYTD